MYLEAAGFEVSLAARGDDGLRMAEEEAPHLVILDLMLPGLDGYEVTKRLRQKGQTPIIMLTARDDAVDKVVGLELGADDYITKPFNPRELVARVRAVLRRAESCPASTAQPQQATIELDDPRIEVGGARSSDGDGVALTPKEFDLLVTLIENRGLVLTREQLLERSGGSPSWATAARSTSTCASSGASSGTPARSRPCGAPATRSPPSGDLGGALANPPGTPGARGRGGARDRRRGVRGRRRGAHPLPVPGGGPGRARPPGAGPRADRERPGRARRPAGRRVPVRLPPRRPRGARRPRGEDLLHRAGAARRRAADGGFPSIAAEELDYEVLEEEGVQRHRSGCPTTTRLRGLGRACLPGRHRRRRRPARPAAGQARSAWPDVAGRVMGAAAIGLAVALALMLLLTRRITRPLTAMQAATHSVAEGDLRTELGPTGTQELDELASDFNSWSGASPSATARPASS